MHNIVSIQALRALAAISVMLCHFNDVRNMMRGRGGDQIELYNMASGVDIFFVISGFIMIYAARDLFAAPNASWTFLARRLTRIVPLYWVTTIIAVFAMNLTGTWKTWATSLLFIPYPKPDGVVTPLLGVGWSLNFEMLFYVVFAAGVALKRQFAFAAITIALTILVVAGHLIYIPIFALRYFADPIVLEFIFGMTIAMIFLRGFTLPAPVRLVMVAVALAAFWYNSPHIPPSSGFRFLQWGLPAAMLVAAAVFGPRDDREGPMMSTANLLGNASYSIYLLHGLVGAMVFRLWPLGLNKWPMDAVLVTGMMVTIGLSIGIYTYVEKPLTKYLQRLLLVRGSSRLGPVSSTAP